MEFFGNISNPKDLITKEWFDNPVIAKAEYKEFIASSNTSGANGAKYSFLKVIPVDYNKPVTIRYRITITPSESATHVDKNLINGIYDIELVITRGAIAYNTFCKFASTTYYPIRYSVYYYLSTVDGINAGNGHLLGFYTYGSYLPTTTTIKRDLLVEVLSINGGTFELADSISTFAERTDYNVTYHTTSSYISAVIGSYHSGDQNTTYTLNYLYDAGMAKSGVGAYAISRYALCMQKPDMTWEKIVDTSVTYSTATTKDVNQRGFLIRVRYYNTTANVANGANLASNTLSVQASSFDARYSTNCGTPASWVNGDYFYLVGTINSEDGLFYLDKTTWWSVALPTTEDGKVYIQIGRVITSGSYSVSLFINHPIYYYKDGGIKEYCVADNKQDVISDLDSIRSGSAIGNGLASWVKASTKPSYTLDEVVDGTTRKLSDYLLSSAISSWAKATNKPSYTLDEVSDGTTRKLSDYLPLSGGTMTGSIVIPNNVPIKFKKADDTAVNVIYLNNNNALVLGAEHGGNTYLSGSAVYIRYGADKTNGITLTNSGATKIAGRLYLEGLDSASADGNDDMQILTSHSTPATDNIIYRRPLSKIYNYLKGKTDTLYLALSGGTMTGGITMATATSAYNDNALKFGSSGTSRIGVSDDGIMGIYAGGYLNITVDRDTDATKGITLMKTALYPKVTNTMHLGTAAYRWQTVNTKGLDVDGSATVTGGTTLSSASSAYNTNGILFKDLTYTRIGVNSEGALGVYAGGSIFLRPNYSGSTTGLTLTNESLYPSVTNVMSLGTSSYRWTNIYTNALRLYGSEGINWTNNSAIDALKISRTDGTAAVVFAYDGYGALTITTPSSKKVTVANNFSAKRVYVTGSGGSDVFLEGSGTNNAYIASGSTTLISFMGSENAVRRGSGNADITLGTDTYKWKVVYAESIKIGDATISWDAEKGALKIDKPIYSTGQVSAFGMGDASNTSGGGTTVDSASAFNLDSSALGVDGSAILGN